MKLLKSLILLCFIGLFSHISAQSSLDSIWGEWELDVLNSSAGVSTIGWNIEITREIKEGVNIDSLLKNSSQKQLETFLLDTFNTPKKIFGTIVLKPHPYLTGNLNKEYYMPFVFVDAKFGNRLLIFDKEEKYELNEILDLYFQNEGLKLIGIKEHVLSYKRRVEPKTVNLLQSKKDLRMYNLFGSVKKVTTRSFRSYSSSISILNQGFNEYDRGMEYDELIFDKKGYLTRDSNWELGVRYFSESYEKNKNKSVSNLYGRDTILNASYIERSKDQIMKYHSPTSVFVRDTSFWVLKKGIIVERFNQGWNNSTEEISYDSYGYEKYIKRVREDGYQKDGILYLYTKVDDFGNWTERIFFELQKRSLPKTPTEIYAEQRVIDYYN